MVERPRRVPLLLLALALAASAVWLLSIDSHLTFIADDWELLVRRQGMGAAYFLDSFHGNVLVGPALLYKLLLATIGMDSATPFFVVSIAAFLTSAVLLFVYLRRRVGGWGALFAAVLVLFLGAAFEDLLFAFQIGYFASVAAGLGMLIALDRENESGDRLACGLLVVSIAFSSVGLAFACGALAGLAFGRRPRLRRAYVALAPLILYGIWWIGWGRYGESNVGIHNLIDAPHFAYDAAAAAIVSLIGLATGDGSEPSQPHLIYGQLLLLPFIALVGWRIHREGKLSRGMAIALAIGLGLWLLTALNHNSQRLPTSSRYQYPSAVALLLIAGEALRGVRLPARAGPGARWLTLGAASALTALAIWGGVSLLHREYVERWRPVGDSLRTTLAAADVAGPAIDPSFQIAFAPSPSVPARTYLDVAAEYGTPAWSEAELVARQEAASADLTIAQAEGLRLTAPGAARDSACRTVRAIPVGAAGPPLGPGAHTIANRTSAPVDVLLARFAAGYSVDLGPLPAGGRTLLAIPRDASPRPWRLILRGAGPVRVCDAAR